MKNNTSAKLQLIISMFIFGTIGAFVRFIPLSSPMIAASRGFTGAIFLTAVILIKKSKPSFKDIKRNIVPLLLTGIFLGVNWILLFEAYKYTTVASATLCYYLAPVFVIIASPFLLKEKITLVKGISVIASLTGMVFVSGILEAKGGNTNFKGILLGIGAAAFYACYVFTTKKIRNLSSYDGTITQLLIAGIVLLPYILLTEDFSSISLEPVSILLLIAVGIVHTGIAYALYFNSLTKLKAQTAAIFSYIDPVVAIMTSVLFLNEKLSLFTVIGGILILGSAIFSEIGEKKAKT